MPFYAYDSSPNRTRYTRRVVPTMGPSVPGQRAGLPPGISVTTAERRQQIAALPSIGRPGLGAIPPAGTGRAPIVFGRDTNRLSYTDQLRAHEEEIAGLEGNEPVYLGGYPEGFTWRAGNARNANPDNPFDIISRFVGEPQFGAPVYRNGAQFTYGARLSVDQKRQWQAFFHLAGFKTSPSGLWGPAEVAAMEALMTLANGQAGMTVETLRANILAQVESGAVQPYSLAEMVSSENALPEALVNELQGDTGAGGGGGAGEPLGPYTVTNIDRQIMEFNEDEVLILLEQRIARQLGRQPTDQEVKLALKRLNAAARNDPTIVKTVTTVDPATGNQDTTTTRDETSLDPQGFAKRFSEEDVDQSERHEYQANRYMEALFGNLGS